jgi:hypothetical protein
MKLRAIRTLVWTALLACAWVDSAACLRAQAPPGPLPPSHPLPPPPPAPPAKKKPQVEPRKTLAGFWKLNMDESDDPRTKFEDARKRKAGNGPGNDPNGGSGGPRVGVGYPPYPGGGPNDPNGPYGRPGGMGGNQDSGLSERLQDAVRPAFSQDILLKESEVDSSNEHSDRVVFYTDGRKLQKSKDDTLQEVLAHWNGPQLVSDEKGPRNTKMSRTLELSSDGRQLYETWHIENGRSASPIVIRYVYDAASQYGP